MIFVPLTGGAGHVGPVLLLDGAEQLEVVEAELGDGAHAAARPPAAQRVRGAGGHLARRSQLREIRGITASIMN